MRERVKKMAQSFRRELRVYRAALKDPRTPWAAKLFLGAGVAYMLSPIDVIPDFIPVVGHLDDLVIVPFLIAVGLRMIPRGLLREYRDNV